MDENESVWNRIEKLERFVSGQDREIKNLKSVVTRIQSEQMYYDSMSTHPMMQPMHRYTGYPYHPAEHPYHRPPVHPYQMSSFVHPPSAIPPRVPARRPLTERNPYQPANSSWLESSPHALTATSTSKRWSAAPNLSSPPDDETLDELFSEQPAQKKHNRQRFVEQRRYIDSETETESESLSRTKPRQRTQSQSQSQSQSKPPLQLKYQSHSQPQLEPESKLGPELEPEPELDLTPEPEPDLGLTPEPEPDLGLTPEPEPDLGLTPESEPEPKLKTKRPPSPRTPPLPEVEVIKVVSGTDKRVKFEFTDDKEIWAPPSRVERPRAAKSKSAVKSMPKRYQNRDSDTSTSDTQFPAYYEDLRVALKSKKSLF